MAAPQSWDCPICLRHVPAKVGECYCGYKRSDPTPERRAGGGAAGVAVAAVALFAVGGGAAYWLNLPALEAPHSAATTTLPAARTSAHGPYEVPPSTTLPAAWKALAIEATPTPAAAASVPQLSPSPSASATPDDSIDAKRAKGASDFEAALGALGNRVSEFRDRLKHYNDQCTRENVQVVGCEPARAELQDLAHQIASDVEAADEAARRSWVDPGQRRGLREKSGLDENGVRDLVKAAADAAHH